MDTLTITKTISKDQLKKAWMQREYFCLWSPLDCEEGENFDYLKSILEQCRENSQGFYWDSNLTMERIFSEWFTDNRGQIRKELSKEREGFEKAFFEDLKYFDPQFDSEGCYGHDETFERFYAKNCLRFISDFYQSDYEWFYHEDHFNDEFQSLGFEELASQLGMD